MARGRRHHGRPQPTSAREIALSLAAETPGRGVWQNQHQRKVGYDRWCEALVAERKLHRQWLAGFIELRGSRWTVYPCRYGSHWMIDTAPRHWHVGRPSGQRT